VITRLVCLGFAAVIVSVGLREQSLALLAVAAAIVAVALAGLGPCEPGRACRGKLAPLWSPAAWARPDLSATALTVAGCAAASSMLAIMLRSDTGVGVLAIACWVLAVGAVVALGPILDRVTRAEVGAALRSSLARRHRPEIASVLAITVVAFVLRVYQLETVPPMFHGDEGEIGLIALSILDGREYPFFWTSPYWRLPYLFSYLQALSMWLFGPTVFGIRMLSVVAGTLCVPVVYAIGRVGWGPVAGAIAAWLVAVSHLHIHYSRVSLIVIESVLLSAVVMLLLALVWIRSRPIADPDGSGSTTSPRPLWTLLLLAGLIAGFSQYFYFSSRVIPVVAAPLLLLLWRAGRITPWQIVAFGFAFVVVVAPLAAHFVEVPGQFTGRMQELSIFDDQYVRVILGPDASLPSSLPALLVEQIRRSLNLFVRAGDRGGFYSGNTPNFDVLTAGLIWLGLGAALARRGHFREIALLVWAGLGLAFGSVLTAGAISAHRVLNLVPAGFLLVGVLVARGWELLGALPGRRAEWLAVPLGATLALWLLAANVTIYFVEYASHDEAAEPALAAREMLKEPGKYHIFYLTLPHFDFNHGAIKFIARGVPAANVTRPAELALPPADGLGTMLIATDNHLAELRELQARLPGGEERNVTAGDGRVVLIVYRIPPTT
jgi:4-amino-4-deoxy-L-arabinose transferase-like glycosyltransferase